jgi:hypothetical protein
MIALPIFGFILVTMLVKARPFIPTGKPGQVLATIKLNFWQKLMVHRVSLYSLGIVIILGLFAGWLNSAMEWITLALAFAILLLPMKYTFTSQGIAVGDAIYRPWNEFNGYQIRGAQVTLRHPAPFANLTLFVTSVEREKIVGFITRRVRSKSYSKE